MKKCLLILSLLAVSSCTRGTLNNQNFNYEDQTTDIVKSCLNIVDEDLNTSIEFNSQRCFRNKYGLAVLNDQFLRVYRDKETNESKYQIYTIIKSNQWTNPYSANYKTESLNAREGDRISTDVSCHQYGCDHTEHFVFTIPKKDIKYISNNYADGDLDHNFTYRIKTRSGLNLDRVIHKAEIKAIYETVEHYKKR